MQETPQQINLMNDPFELLNPTVEDFCLLNNCEDSLFNSLLSSNFPFPEVKIEDSDSSNPSSPSLYYQENFPQLVQSSASVPTSQAPSQPIIKRELEESDEEECEGSSEEDSKPNSPKRKRNIQNKSNKRVKIEPTSNDDDFLKSQQEKHKISEKQRRLQTSELLETMKNLLPGKKKLTKLQILEETLKYVHSLQEQNYKQALELQLMRRVYYPPH